AGKERNNACRDACDDRAGGTNITARRCNDDEAANRAGTKSKHTRFATQRILKHCPRERCDRGSESRGHECIRGNPVRRERTSCVKAVPPHPEQPCSDHAKHHAMRRHYFSSKSEPVTKKYAKNERRPAGRQVQDGATGEVDRG